MTYYPARETVDALAADDVIVVLLWGQSNPDGTNSYLSEATQAVWPDEYADTFEAPVLIWDQAKRNTKWTHAHTDPDDPDNADERHKFRNLTPGYGRSSNFYPWSTGFTHGADGPGVGPEMQLGKRLVQAYRRPVYIVKCCRGGTGVADLGEGASDWNIAGLTSNSGEPKAESLLHLMTEYYWGPALWSMVNDLGIARSNIKLAGVVNMLGATDSNDEATANAYRTNLGAIIDHVRPILNPSSPESVPWVVCRSEAYYEANGDPVSPHAYIGTVRAFQEAVANARTGVEWVSTDDVNIGADGEHFDGFGQVQLGNVMYQGLARGTFMSSPQGDVDPTVSS